MTVLTNSPIFRNVNVLTTDKITENSPQVIKAIDELVAWAMKNRIKFSSGYPVTKKEIPYLRKIKASLLETARLRMKDKASGISRPYSTPKILDAVTYLEKKRGPVYSTRMNGLGAAMVTEDFGGMNGIWDDVSNWASSTLDKTVANLQTQAVKTVTSAVQNYVVKLTGADGTVKNVTLTPAQAAAYQASGTLPAGVLPAGFILPPKSFMEEYGQIITYAGIGLAGILAITIIVKMYKK